MDYPVWHTYGINTGLIIGLISVIHVFVAQFAVGGGIYLAWMEGRARRDNSPELLLWLEKHTRFFLLLTMVFGGVSGVGIWFIMSVSTPEGTSLLIQNFMFFWAAEWGFFLIEITSLLFYYYSYPASRDGRMNPKTHMFVGWIYAFGGFMSLVLINGIVSFMLTPGDSLETNNIWSGFFNPTFLPSLVYRTALCLLLAGMFALLTAPKIAADSVRRKAIRVSSLWICIPLLALLASSFWYFLALPPDRQAAIARRTVDIRPFVLAYGWVVPVVFLLGVFAFIRAERLRRPLGLLILCVGLVLSGSFEWIRETGRRPWLAPGYVYSNGVWVAEAAAADIDGISSISGWLKNMPVADAGQESKLATGKGAMIFAQQCGSCHGLGTARIDIVPRLKNLTPAGITAQLAGQGKRLDYMPPFFGDKSDREALAEYLSSISQLEQ